MVPVDNPKNCTLGHTRRADEPTSPKGVITFGVAVNDFNLRGHRFDSTDTTARWCPSLLARYFFNNSNNYIYI